MTYKEIVTYIEEIPRFTRKHSLAHTREMLLFLGNPQNGKKIIHVAGTNGKGSVCAYLDAMLRAEGSSQLPPPWEPSPAAAGCAYAPGPTQTVRYKDRPAGRLSKSPCFGR